MCGGNTAIQSRRPPRLAQEMKPNTPHVAADGALLLASCCPARRQPAAAAAAGLAIVAALEAELVQSGSATTASKPAESAPPASPTSPLPIPIPIAAASAHEEMINEAGYTVNKNHSRAALQRSIFSTSLSPPSTSYMASCNLRIREANDDFLGVCFSCKRPLGPGKDIYMYRGDRAFCSMECRHKHITTDESLLCKVQINQQCVQASYPTNQSKFTPSITIRVLI